MSHPQQTDSPYGRRSQRKALKDPVVNESATVDSIQASEITVAPGRGRSNAKGKAKATTEPMDDTEDTDDTDAPPRRKRQRSTKTVQIQANDNEEDGSDEADDVDEENDDGFLEEVSDIGDETDDEEGTGSEEEAEDMVDPVDLGYTPEEHVRMLLCTFLSETPQLAPLQLKIQMREHAKIALRHMCLLRDQDLRGLAQSDSYLARSNQPSGGGANVQFAAAVRHADVRHCAVGAYAFHLLYLFRDFGKDAGDFFRSLGWANCKAFPADMGMFEQEQSYADARDPFAKVKLQQNVHCTNVTHAGCYAGSVEAQEIGLSVQDICQGGGRWVTKDPLINTYLSSAPYAFARIFPFLEDALFDKDREPVEYKLWIEAIEREMNDIDTGVDTLDRSKAPNKTSRKFAVRGGDSVSAYQLAQPFLLMLARFRRNKDTTWASWHLPLFVEFRHVFEHPRFLEFKNRVAKSLKAEDEERCRTMMPEPPATLDPDAAQYLKDLFSDQERRESPFLSSIEATLVDLKSTESGLRTDIEELKALAKMTMQAFEDALNRGSLPSTSSKHLSTGRSPIQPVGSAHTADSVATTSGVMSSATTGGVALESTPSVVTDTTSPAMVNAESSAAVRPLLPTGTAALTSAALIRAAMAGLASAEATIALANSERSSGTPFMCKPTEGLTVKKLIAEQVTYRQRGQGKVDRNVARVISNRKHVALYAYLLARTQFNSSQKDVEAAALSVDGAHTNAAITYLQNKKDSEHVSWKSFLSWCMDRLLEDGRESGDAEIIAYLDRRSSTATRRSVNMNRSAGTSATE
ncbi:hypothetical protein BGZ94_003472 [Podila epigama]|nr:hypothetical protein BGZ94_003472 [Podila epigama]